MAHGSPHRGHSQELTHSPAMDTDTASGPVTPRTELGPYPRFTA